MLTVAGRKLLNNPQRILGPHLRAGMTALDVGCGVGYFTIPMARLVGETGQVVAVDAQPQMVDATKAKADQEGLSNIDVRQVGFESLDIERWAGAVDFGLIFFMLHEVEDPDRLVGQVFDALKPGGVVLFAEPVVHVDASRFAASINRFVRAGFSVAGRPRIPISRAALLKKP